ncbi:hypothetical protein AAW01_12295 [Aurantiacibacter gangjinensis]|uniref:HTH luxR-type domain-containing protein n=2 Tax=Aurantiacibacter gangjinensis TaxID=502682 RepID=A0A0G9MK19_9SPHN|nr:hypothetical protein AAW01_12295 [Aurantiacibacter gangjinensis]
MMDKSAQIVADAYAVVSQPERLLDIHERLQSLVEAHIAGTELTGDVRFHFAHAADLLAGEVEPGLGPFDPFDGNGQDSPAARSAALVLDRHLQLVRADKTVFEDHLKALGEPLPEWIWHPIDGASGETSMRSLLARGDASGAIRLMRSPDDARGALFTASTGMLDGAPHLLLHHLGLRWDDEAGSAFIDLLGLTRSEARVLEWLVGGGTLRELADDRGTALGTVRNQTKSLLRKVGATSQIEAVCMWAGFRQRWLDAQSIDPEPAAEGPRPRGKGSGSQALMRFERHGLLGGMPVLYMHSMLGGPHVMPAVDAAMRKAGLELITPWRPGYGERTVQADRFAMVRDFVDELPGLLNRLAIPRVRVLGSVGGAAFALAFAKVHPELTHSVTLASPCIPITHRSELKHLRTAQSLPIEVARIAPSLNRWYVRAVLARLRRKGAMEYVREYFSASPVDLDWMEELKNQEFIRNSLNEAFAQSGEFGVAETELNAMDWTPLFEGLESPVRIIHGSDDVLARPQLVHPFAERHGFCTEGPIEQSGSFLLFQQPDLIAARLKDQ